MKPFLLGGYRLRELIIEGLLILAFVFAGIGLLIYLHKKELI